MNTNALEKKVYTLRTNTYILDNTKRVSVITGEDLFEAYTADEITYLLKNEIIMKARKYDERNITYTLSKKFTKEDLYIIVSEKTNYLNIVIALVLIGMFLALIMHQMWPKNIRHYTGYVFYLLGGFLVFMLVLGVIRLILFVVTFFLKPPGLWLFPNLFADVGFMDSFIPVWSWHGEETKPKKD